MTPQELLEDTITYYSVNPNKRRCQVNGSGCRYSPKTIKKPTSEGCAIGRHLDGDVKRKFDVSSYGSISMIARFNKDVFALAPQWMQDIDIDFLMDIQGLHDYFDYWNEAGLSQEGKEYVEQIKKRFGL